MTDRPRIEINANGEATGTRLYLDGQDITSAVFGIEWEHSLHGRPTAKVYLRIVELTAIGSETEWHGLDRVPTEVLQDELDSREIV